MIFHERIIRFTLFLLTNGQLCSNIRNFPEIDDDHNSGTKYARGHEICVKMSSFGYSTVFH